jgi:sigma-E factor negative regulatory protein RseA
MTLDSNPSPEQQQRAALSAMMDGDATAGDDACRAWRGDAACRADWHAYHLIGDVMRSDEHRADATRDARMLARLREQLSREPVVLAPAPSLSPAAPTPFAQKRRVRAWLMPSAVAAGFAVVAGTLVVTRVSSPDAADRGSVVASGSAVAPVSGARTVSAAAPAPVATGLESAPTMIRNAELDRYLAAHRQQAGGALAPGGVVRQAAVAAPGR